MSRHAALSFLLLTLSSAPAWAQTGTEPGMAAPPTAALPPAAPPPAAAPPASPPPAAAPPASPPPAAPPPGDAPAVAPPPPAYAAGAYDTGAPPGSAPAELEPAQPFDWPGFSMRVDPLNWLLEGRLGVELEAELTSFLTVELVPVFVVNGEPPSFNFSGREDTLSQESNGLGPISGTSIGVGFWLDELWRGYVLRVALTNYSYRYETADDFGPIDRVDHVERHLYGMFGSHNKWGAFTLAGGIGLGVELNKQTRCVGGESDCDGELQIQIADDAYTDLNSPLSPVQLVARLSLGFVIE